MEQLLLDYKKSLFSLESSIFHQYIELSMVDQPEIFRVSTAKSSITLVGKIWKVHPNIFSFPGRYFDRFLENSTIFFSNLDFSIMSLTDF